jgi:hypothetical protein
MTEKEILWATLSNVRLLTPGEVSNMGDDDILDIINVTPYQKCDREEQELRLGLLQEFADLRFPTRITSSVLMEGGIYVIEGAYTV